MELKRIRIEVAFALPEQQVVIALELPAGTTLRQAVEASKLAERFSGIDLQNLQAGVFGAPRAPDAMLSDGERVEIYRPLRMDPKELRRRRAREAR